jgi:flagellar hook assembly protein FlgD
VIPTRASVSVEVYDSSGRLVARLVDARQEKGPHSIGWNGTDYRGNPVSSGVYLYRLTAGGETVSKKMVLLR